MYVNLLNIKGCNNPEASTSKAEDKANVSTSGLTNDVVGVCPKCSKSMSQAMIASGENVFYCETCRVALPTPNQA